MTSTSAGQPADPAKSRLSRASAAVLRSAGGKVFGSRKWLDQQVAAYAAEFRPERVLEVGSGRQDLGHNAYSMKRHFPLAKEFVQSDINPAYGHVVVDVTTMTLEEEFDAILCISVLEHVPVFWEAIPRLRRALVPRGTLFISVPLFFPYHDEPEDFWRITTHGLRSLLTDFAEADVQYRGLRRLPFAVTAIATK